MRPSIVLILSVVTPLVFAPVSAAAEKQLLWGDTHVHSNLSTDAFMNGNFDFGPDEAYRYARGMPLLHPTTGARVQLQTPLDFLVVSDHAEGFGVSRAAAQEGLPREGLGVADRMQAWAIEILVGYMAGDPTSIGKILAFASPPGTDDVREWAKTPTSIAFPNLDRILRSTWAATTNASDANNDPGNFTALIGWEWSSTPAAANLHRVVFTSSDANVAQKFLPCSSSDSNYPEDLWACLEKASEDTGADFVAIPHNSNISRGFMFPIEKRLRGTKIDRDWIEQRARWETVVEATQIKGDSETHPSLSPEDPFADFESFPHYISPDPMVYTPEAGDFVRSALQRGLEIEEEFGANPYRFGLIGATDSHTGLAGAEEPNFWGKFMTDSTPELGSKTLAVIEKFGWVASASGIAGVWAEENTRESIFAAFKRREVYSTTGPRIALRFYGAQSQTADDASAPNGETIRAAGVPMGGELRQGFAAPSFFIEAAKDPRSGHLDRIQMIKGWRANGASHERIYDVVGAGERERDANGSLLAVPNTVDLTTGTYSNEHGAATLTATWTDPDFDPAHAAFYYVRVLEIPTPRHATLDALALGLAAEETGQPATLQERAYSSPIHYRPGRAAAP